MDTMMICDCIAPSVKKAATCQPCLNVTCTNCNDAVIVGIICATILIIALVGIIGYFAMKVGERKASKEAETERRENEENDRKWKQKADMQDKLLSYYKDRLIKDKKDDKGNVIVYDDDNCNKYVEQLKNLINELNKAI